MMLATTNWMNASSSTMVSLVHILTFASYPRVFYATQVRPTAASTYPWIAEIQGGGMTGDVLQGQGSNNTLSVDVIDFQQALTADVASTVFEGMSCTLTTGFASLTSPSDFVTYGSFVVDNVETTNMNLRYRFNLRDKGLRFDQYIYQTGDDGYPTSKQHPRTVTGNPMAILNDVLINQLGYSSGDVNTAILNYYQTGLFAGSNMVFHFTQPSQAKTWLRQEIYDPLGGYAFWNGSGQYTPYFILPQSQPTVDLILADRQLGTIYAGIQSPLPVMGVGAFCAEMLTLLDYDGQNYNTAVGSVYSPGITRYGLQDLRPKQSRGLLSPLGGALYARIAQYAMFRRYGLKPRILKCQVSWPGVRLELGDLVYVTHPLIPNKYTGTLGLNQNWFEVQRKTPNWQAGTVDLELIDVQYENLPVLQVAPNGTPNWAGSTPTQRATYGYVNEGQNIY